MKSDEVILRGDFEAYCITPGGKILQRVRERNLIVNLGRTNMVKLLGGDSAGLAITKIGVGTSNTAASATDSGLTGAFIKALNTASTVNVYTTNTVQFGYQIDTTEANGMTIWEFGLFNSGSALTARKVLSASIVKTSSFAIAGTWTLTIT